MSPATFFDGLERGHPHSAVGQHGFQPIDLVACRRRVAKEDLIVEHAALRQRPQPVEVPLAELSVGGPIPGAHLFWRTIDQIAVVIAAHMNGAERHHRIQGPLRVQRAAGHIA